MARLRRIVHMQLLKRRPRSTNRSGNTGRFQPYSSSASQVSAEPKLFYKAVCLLPSPTWNTVPRGKVRKICVSMHGQSIKVGVRKILNLKLPNFFQRCWELTALN